MAAERARRARLRRRRRAVAAGASLLVVAGGGAAAAASSGGSAPARTLATVQRGSVSQTVESSGTISASAKSTPSFAVSGTVSAVAVKIGQSVAAGQALATLDTTALQATLDSAGSTVASARQKLAADTSGQTSTSTSDSPVANLTAVTTAAPGGGVSAAQRAVIDAQRAVDAGQTAVDKAQRTVAADVLQNTRLRDAQQETCAGEEDQSEECTSATADYETYADTLSADSAILDKAIAAQDANLGALAKAISALDRLIAAQQSSNDAQTPAPSTPTAGSDQAAGNQGSGGTQSSGASDEPASASQLAADQAAIDAAEAQLAVAKQDLTAATLRSPIAGRVAAVSLTVGANAGSGTITIVGTGIQQVTTTVPLAKVDLIKPGERVTVRADGIAATLPGTVVSRGLLSTTSGSSTTFPVTIRLDKAVDGLYDGTGAEVSIATGSATDVLLVPNSAIHAGPANTHTVTVLTDGKPTTVRVTLGVAGPDATEVTSGLTAGQQVILADLTTALPSTTTATPNRGNLPAGFPAGGPPGGTGR